MDALDEERAAETFRALCRSSPWRWKTLRFEVSWREPDVSGEPPPVDDGVRAWLRRPGALRVESVDGTLLYSTTGTGGSRGDSYVNSTRRSWLLPPRLVTPVFNSAGLVRRRPEAAYGEPVFENPRFSAMLDPVELAGNAPVAYETPFANVIEIHSLRQVDQQGRDALEAVVVPNHNYRPFTPGYPLIGSGETTVTIDWETGVCLSTLALDGPLAGSGHSVRVLGVDEYMPDDLFVEASNNLSDVRRHLPWEVS